jgi:sulfur carrier protein ThiS
MAVKVRVRLFFQYQELGPDGKGDFEFELGPQTTVEQALAELGLPDETKVVLINGRQARPGQLLQTDDLLVVFPPVEGG